MNRSGFFSSWFISSWFYEYVVDSVFLVVDVIVYSLVDEYLVVGLLMMIH